MLKLDFIVSDLFLAYQIINKGFAYDMDMQEYMIEVDREMYRKIRAIHDFNIIINNQEYIDYLKKLFDGYEFIGMYKDLKEYASNMETYWHANEYFTARYFREVLRINPNTHITAYISSPEIGAGGGISYLTEKTMGRYMGKGVIVYGDEDGVNDLDKDYTGLVHESLHEIIPYNDNWDDNEKTINHAIIELATDYELYFRKTGKSTYGNCNEHLATIADRIYPYWLIYLNLSPLEIKERLKNDRYISKEGINLLYELESSRDILTKMNIFEFRDFCLEKIYTNKNIDDDRIIKV